MARFHDAAQIPEAHFYATYVFSELAQSLYPPPNIGRLYIARRQGGSGYRTSVVRVNRHEGAVEDADDGYALGPVEGKDRAEALTNLLEALENEAEERMLEMDVRIGKNKGGIRGVREEDDDRQDALRDQDFEEMDSPVLKPRGGKTGQRKEAKKKDKDRRKKATEAAEDSDTIVVKQPSNEKRGKLTKANTHVAKEDEGPPTKTRRSTRQKQPARSAVKAKQKAPAESVDLSGSSDDDLSDVPPEEPAKAGAQRKLKEKTVSIMELCGTSKKADGKGDEGSGEGDGHKEVREENCVV
ncbi:hypothetical protein EK21DRAFT_113521 [Setomelanomma holmii]|uniref:Uncharacterized protein n=1 Tax=Setomelanomma holmii TaxID=210430 RepID=A0A9P4H617_9PLEO|nr:hypothetical protein EK21DRAFT_113521 [Setomelanomma holmii]